MLDHRTLPEHRQLLQARQRWILETERRNFWPKNLRGGGKREEEGVRERGERERGGNKKERKRKRERTKIQREKQKNHNVLSRAKKQALIAPQKIAGISSLFS